MTLIQYLIFIRIDLLYFYSRKEKHTIYDRLIQNTNFAEITFRKFLSTYSFFTKNF